MKYPEQAKNKAEFFKFAFNKHMMNAALVAFLGQAVLTSCLPDEVSAWLKSKQSTVKTADTLMVKSLEHPITFVLVEDKTIDKTHEEKVHAFEAKIVEEYSGPGDQLYFVPLTHNSYPAPLLLSHSFPRLKTIVFGRADTKGKALRAEEMKGFQAQLKNVVSDIKKIPNTGPTQLGTDLFGSLARVSDLIKQNPKASTAISLFSDLEDNKGFTNVDVSLNGAKVFIYQANTTTDQVQKIQARRQFWTAYLLNHGASQVLFPPGYDVNYLKPHFLGQKGAPHGN